MHIQTIDRRSASFHGSSWNTASVLPIFSFLLWIVSVYTRFKYTFYPWIIRGMLRFCNKGKNILVCVCVSTLALFRSFDLQAIWSWHDKGSLASLWKDDIVWLKAQNILAILKLFLGMQRICGNLSNCRYSRQPLASNFKKTFSKSKDIKRVAKQSCLEWEHKDLSHGKQESLLFGSIHHQSSSFFFPSKLLSCRMQRSTVVGPLLSCFISPPRYRQSNCVAPIPCSIKRFAELMWGLVDPRCGSPLSIKVEELTRLSIPCHISEGEMFEIFSSKQGWLRES